MELTWPLRFRIAAAIAVGILLIGLLLWPMVKTPTGYEPISLAAGNVSFSSIASLVALAFISGFISYFVCWPYGTQIAPLAVPAGLTVWAFRTGSLSEFYQQNPDIQELTTIYGTLKWEPFFWLFIIAVGFAGIRAAYSVAPVKNSFLESKKRPKSNQNNYLFAVSALFASILISQFCIMFLARDISFADAQLGSVISQPNVGQISLAVTVSFGLAAFLIKKFLDAGYTWAILSTAFVSFAAISLYAKEDVLKYLNQHWPAVYFSNVSVAILPLQMVAFGTLGTIGGYWLAIKYSSWRKHA